MKLYFPLFAVILLVSAVHAQEPAAAIGSGAEIGKPRDVVSTQEEANGIPNAVATAGIGAAAQHSPPKPPFGEETDKAWRPARPRGGVEKKGSSDDDPQPGEPDSHFQWSTAFKQSMLFLGIQHGYAMTQPKTRSALAGPFIRDYFRSVKRLHGWRDGGRFFTNYIAHPMQGSFTGYIQVQNDPKGKYLHFENTKPYWISRLKAMAWSAAWSTQFEIGPISQASIGNVGLHGKQTWVDLVVTPTVGSAMLVAEDALDRFVIRKLERRFAKNFWIKIFARMLLNPTRTVANAIAFKEPWHRHTQR